MLLKEVNIFNIKIIKSKRSKNLVISEIKTFNNIKLFQKLEEESIVMFIKQ